MRGGIATGKLAARERAFSQLPAAGKARRESAAFPRAGGGVGSNLGPRFASKENEGDLRGGVAVGKLAIRERAFLQLPPVAELGREVFFEDSRRIF